LETIKTVFQDFNLVYGTWQVKGIDGNIEWVRPQDIKTTALLTVEGELDDISGSGQTAAAHGLCSGVADKHSKHLEVPGAGHYGIFSGRRWRDIVYPQVRQFILDHAAAPLKAATPKRAKSPAKKTVQTPVKTAIKTAVKSKIQRAKAKA
jgi:poly(3-hydroxybutyrate) depolymerase